MCKYNLNLRGFVKRGYGQAMRYGEKEDKSTKLLILIK